ncbi:MAG: sialate O-acetylesterase, partial [Acidobacteria bacterium]|nr:sialate O-acetylesterase [Acidobacteriota bacterium]
KADPGEQVTVRFRGQSASTQADTIGRWSVSLQPLAAGGPDDLTVQGTNTITLHDVLVGDVWLASGQSNMEFTVGRSNNAQQEIAAANYPRMRLFRVAHKVSDYPLDDVTGSWATANADSVPQFSAVGYFFARQLHQHLKVPVAVIESNWGGTPAESWTSLPALTSDPALLPHLHEWAMSLSRYPEANARYETALKKWESQAAAAKAQGSAVPRRPGAPQGPGHHWTPSGLYNGMIAPLTPMAIRGVIWYQGESNAGRARAFLYERLFGAMIQDWRRAWAQGDFPFLFVQLANYGRTGPDSHWPELREAQLKTLALRNTGMAVTIDIGNPDDIHPTNKQDVGKRLALAARAVAYGEKLVHSGPLFRTAAPEGGALRVWFDHIGGGLTAKGGELKSFEIAGADRKFVPAAARIEGQTVVVSSPQVAAPVHVRYAWTDTPEANLYNREGLAASPFRSGE